LGLRLGCYRFEFIATIGIETLGSMQTPNLGRRIKCEHARNLSSRTTGDHDNARAALGLNTRQHLLDTGPRARFESIDAKSCQRSVVIGEQ
jgi:hypothetical protein